MLEIINVGTNPNDGTGDTLRNAFTKVNSNFATLFGGVTYAVDYGVTGNGVTDDTTALRAAITAAEASGKRCIVLPPTPSATNGIRITDELNTTIFTQPWGIVGAGRNLTTIQVSAFGKQKRLISCPAQLTCLFQGFRIRGNNNINDPMGIYLPEGSSYVIDNFASSQLFNTVIYSSRPFNCVINNTQLFFSGQQFLWRDITSNSSGGARVSATAGSTTLTSSTNSFEAADVGKEIIWEQTDSAYTTALIASFVSAGEITINKPAPETVTNVTFSFAAVRGAMTSGSATLTAERAIFDSGDVGRIIHVVGAGENGSILTTTIASFVDSVTVTLATAASITILAGRIYNAPTLVISGFPRPGGDTPINDIKLHQVLIEGYRGPAFLTQGGGTHVYISQCKSHGRGSGASSNYGVATESILIDGTSRTIINSFEQEFGHPTFNGASIKITGSNPSVSLDNITVNAASYGQGWCEFAPSIVDGSSLHIGSVIGSNIRARHFGSFIKTNSVAARQRVFGSGSFATSYEGSNDYRDLASAQFSSLFGATRSGVLSVGNAIARNFIPAARIGSVEIIVEENVGTGNFSGKALFDIANNAIFKQLGSDNFLVTTGVLNNNGGTNGALNLSIDSTTGLMYISNRTGSSKTIIYSIIGY